MRVTDQTLNRLRVLKAIRRASPVSRSELPDLTGLSAGTITQLTADLLRRALITERKESARRGGRPRTHLEIDAGQWIVIGASLAGEGRLTTAFVDLAGKSLFSVDIAMEKRESLPELAWRIARALDQAIEASPFERSRIARVGIGLPAVVDCNRGVVHFIMMLPPGPVPFAQIIEGHLGLPVNIENDSVCKARAEHWFGRAMDVDTFAMIDVGYTIGSAEYVGGVPRYGANGFNSELAHVKTASGKEARRCHCGARGCLTAYASIHGMLEHARLLGDLEFPQIAILDARFEQFLDRAESGDAKARQDFAKAGFHLGRAVANKINATDPGTVLILIPGERFGALISASFREALFDNAMPTILANTRIVSAVSNSAWRWQGTAALALEQTFLSAGEAVPQLREAV
jgi:transcriptional regulator of PTS gene